MADKPDTNTQIQQCLDQLQHTRSRDRKKIRDQLAELVLPWTRSRVACILHGGFPRLYREEQTDDLLGWAVLRFLRAIDAGVCPETVTDMEKLIGQHIWLAALDRIDHYFGKPGSNRSRRVGQKDGDMSPFPDNITGFTTMERWSLLHQFASDLPEMERKAFELHYYDGKKMAEIGKELAISKDAAKKRWQKACDLLSRRAQMHQEPAVADKANSPSSGRQQRQSTSRRSMPAVQPRRNKATRSEPPTAFKTGMHVEGCTLVSYLGRGGFGEVWKATTPEGQAIAIKFAPAHPSRLTPDQRRAIQKKGYIETKPKPSDREFRGWELMMAIRHPNLLKVFGLKRFHEHIAFATELADQSLRDVMMAAKNDKIPLPATLAISVVRQAARGLDYLHRRGLNHQDVKPANLFFIGDTLKIGDFTLVGPSSWPEDLKGAVSLLRPKPVSSWPTAELIVLTQVCLN